MYLGWHCQYDGLKFSEIIEMIKINHKIYIAINSYGTKVDLEQFG